VNFGGGGEKGRGLSAYVKFHRKERSMRKGANSFILNVGNLCDKIKLLYRELF